MIKLFLKIIFIYFFNQSLLFADIGNNKINEWVEIDKYDSSILVNSNIIFNNKVNHYPKYEKLIKWVERDLAHGEIGHWLYYYDNKNLKTKLCNNICFDISYYEVEKSTWIADIYRSYNTKKNIKYFYNTEKEPEYMYEFTSKLNGFKSLENWVNFQKFIDLETNQNCFIFGTQWHHGYDFPYAILDGIFCKSKDIINNNFTNDEIENIVHNIGIKKIRKIPTKPKFILLPVIQSNKNKKQNNIKLNKSKTIYCKNIYSLNVYDYPNLHGKCYDDQIEITHDEFLKYIKASDDSSNNSSLEEKLRKLKNLFEKNLITKDDYNIKKKELLDSF